MANKNVSEKSFNDAMAALEKSWGKGFNQNGLADAVYKSLATGYDDLDCRLTRGASGLYKGGIIEIYGGEGGGKSSVAMRTAGYVQRAGGRVMWIDAEAGFSEDLALINGCDPSKMVMPDLVETKKVMDNKKDQEGFSLYNVNEILTMIQESVETNAFDLIVLDSVAALMPERIISDDFDPNKASMPTEVAVAFSALLKKIVPVCKKTETSVIFINQIRDKVGDMYKKETTPGGRALKFFASQRIQIDKIGGEGALIYHQPEDGNKELVGHYSRVKIIKNKRNVPTPYAIEIPIYYIKYFPDDAKKCYDFARALQEISLRQGVLTWKDDDGKIILQETGESVFLTKIRDQKLEARLAKVCVEAEAGDKNKGRTEPIKVSEHVKKLAATYVTEKYDKTEKSEDKPDKKKKSKAVAIDLDE